MGTSNVSRPLQASALLEPIDPVVRLPEVLEIVGVGRSTLYALIRDGRFPAPIHLSARCRGWRRGTVLAWVEARAQLTAAA
jgi:prophage regulatory protein